MRAKRYRIEGQGRDEAPILRLHEGSRGARAAPEEAAPAGGGDERIGAILAAVREIRALVEPAERDVGAAIESARKEIGEIYALRSELDMMKDAITSTKREIATLYRSENQGKGMRRVAGELDAVVEATERATTTILAAVEEIETHAGMLRAAGAAEAEAILDRVVVLYESCNFQDLTGQRISKIVGVLQFVEERLDRMLEVWGGLDAFRGLIEDGAPSPSEDDPRSLLNGPRLEEDAGHVDQGDIDALFN